MRAGGRQSKEKIPYLVEARNVRTAEATRKMAANEESQARLRATKKKDKARKKAASQAPNDEKDIEAKITAIP